MVSFLAWASATMRYRFCRFFLFFTDILAVALGSDCKQFRIMICVMRRMEATPILVCGRDMQTWALGLRLIKCGDQVVSAWTWAPSGCIFCLGFLISEIQVSVLMEAGLMRLRRLQVSLLTA